MTTTKVVYLNKSINNSMIYAQCTNSIDNDLYLHESKNAHNKPIKIVSILYLWQY